MDKETHTHTHTCTYTQRELTLEQHGNEALTLHTVNESMYNFTVGPPYLQLHIPGSNQA